jgi:ribonucleoside-triphosphate reductase
MEEMSDIRSNNMFTFPVSTISLLYQNGEFVDKEFAEWAITHNMKWSDSNLFVDDSVNSLSNCCRLKSDIRDLGYFNSVGGTALKVGSVKVNTINLARLALDTNSEAEYLETLANRVWLNLQALDCVRYIIRRNVEKGLLPNFDHGLVDFEHLYNTIGFIGIYETMKKFGYTRKDELGNTYYTKEAYRFGQAIFAQMRSTMDAFIKEYNCDYQINTEQIPGETAAAKLMKKDKFFYPSAEIYDLPLYGNQFIPLGIQTTLQERVKIAAAFDSYCNGGSILHANIEAPFNTFEQAWDMVHYIADQGVTYFAFNTKIQACAKNHGFYGKVCPICGGPVETEYTRIVGFYTPVRTYSKERKEEYGMRRWENVNAN